MPFGLQGSLYSQPSSQQTGSVIKTAAAATAAITSSGTAAERRTSKTLGWADRKRLLRPPVFSRYWLKRMLFVMMNSSFYKKNTTAGVKMVKGLAEKN